MKDGKIYINNAIGYSYDKDIPKFKKLLNISEINKDIFLYKNFMPSKWLNNAIENLNFVDEELWWNQHWNYEPGDAGIFHGKMSPGGNFSIQTKDLQYEIINAISPEYWTNGYTDFVRLLPGDLSEPMISMQNPKEFVIKADYKVVFIFGNFTGGSIYWPDQNFEYAPENGDLLIWPATEEYKSGVKEIISGTRYSYVDWMYKHAGYYIA